jgi:alkylhydroperoxidase family enzyme
MEALFTAGQYQLVSMALNSLGIQLDPGLEHRLPADLPRPAVASRPQAPRLASPRLPPLGGDERTEEQRALLAPFVRDDGSVLDLYATLVRHPQLFGPRLAFGTYLRSESGLPPRTRELLILRTAWNIRAEYEWAHHVAPAREAGLTDEEIDRVAGGPDAPGWAAEDAAVLRAADELRREAFVSDPTWAALSEHYDVQRLIEIVYTVGGYTMTGLAINSFGVQVEDGYPAFPGP